MKMEKLFFLFFVILETEKFKSLIKIYKKDVKSFQNFQSTEHFHEWDFEIFTSSFKVKFFLQSIFD